MKKEKAAIVWNELKIKKVATHKRIKGVLLAASLNPLTKIDKLERIFPNVMGDRFLSFKEDSPLINKAGTKANAVQKILTYIARVLVPASGELNHVSS